MSQLVTVVQCDYPANMMRNRSAEEGEREEEEEESNWRRILAVSLLVTALFLVGGAIFLHIKEEQQDQSQEIYPKSHFLTLGIPPAIAVDPDMSQIPQNGTNFERSLLYNYDYYNRNNSNNDIDSDSDSDSDGDSGTVSDSDSENDNEDDSDSEYYYDNRSGDAVDTEYNSSNNTITKSATTTTPIDYSSESTEEEEDMEDEVEGDDFRSRLKKEQRPQQMAAHNPHNSIKKSIRNSTESTSSTLSSLLPSSLTSSSSPLPPSSTSEESREASGTTNKLTELCLQCICETATECRPVECGLGVPCGLFRISLPYWVDAGRPRLRSTYARNMTEHAAYLKCVNNPFCAAQTVTGNIAKFARDCNHDGKIDCFDHAKLHILGPSGCLRYDMPPIFATRLEGCMAKFASDNKVSRLFTIQNRTQKIENVISF